MTLTSKTYNLSLATKIIFGSLELALGLVVFTINPDDVAWLLAWLQHIASGHANIYHLAGYASAALAAGKLVTALYLMVHGLPKILIGLALWRRQLWAYPVALTILAAFMLYQIYLAGYLHSSFMIAVSVIDAIIALVVLREFSAHRASLVRAADNQT